MADEDKPQVFDLANPSRKIFVAIGGLIIFVLFLIAFSAAIAVRFLEPSFHFTAVILLLFIPLSGLLLATKLILGNLQNLSRSRENELWQLMSLDEQKRKFREKIQRISANVNLTEAQIKDLQIDYLAAEDLALRQIEQERKIPLSRRAKVAGEEFDAIFISRNALTLIEIVLLTEPNFQPTEFFGILKKIAPVKRKSVRFGFDAKIKILLIIVKHYESDDDDELRSSLIDIFASTPVNADIRFFDFEALRKNFTTR